MGFINNLGTQVTCLMNMAWGIGLPLKIDEATIV